MNFTLGDAGFPAFLDFDVRYATKQDLQKIVELILNYSVVVMRNQSLSTQEQISFCESIGSCNNLNPSMNGGPGQETEIIHNRIIKMGNHSSYAHISNWHADAINYQTRKPLHFLYAVKDTAYSKTSWIDTIKVYENMPAELKNRIADKRITFPPSSAFNSGTTPEFDIVHTNTLGRTGIFYPFLQEPTILDTDEDEANDIHRSLSSFIPQEQFVYDHYWQDNDIVISSQWHSLHARTIFDTNTDRTMHRIALDYNKVLS